MEIQRRLHPRVSDWKPTTLKQTDTKEYVPELCFSCSFWSKWKYIRNLTRTGTLPPPNPPLCFHNFLPNHLTSTQKKGFKGSPSRKIVYFLTLLTHLFPPKLKRIKITAHNAKQNCLAQTLSPFYKPQPQCFLSAAWQITLRGYSNAPTSQSWMKTNLSSHLCIIH